METHAFRTRTDKQESAGSNRSTHSISHSILKPTPTPAPKQQAHFTEAQRNRGGSYFDGHFLASAREKRLEVRGIPEKVIIERVSEASVTRYLKAKKKKIRDSKRQERKTGKGRKRERRGVTSSALSQEDRMKGACLSTSACW
eukprot:3742696-Rhodomonas_salina.1